MDKIKRRIRIAASAKSSLDMVKTLTDEEKKLGQTLQQEGVTGVVHIGTFPLANLCVFYISENFFDKVRILKKKQGTLKIINLLKPSVDTIFSHFKPRESLHFLVLYGDNEEKYKARTILAARVYHERISNKEKRLVI